MTVVTQFLRAGGSGALSEIRRVYVQNGRVVANSQSTVAGNPGDSLTPEFCKAQKLAFGDEDIFAGRGGFAQTSDAVSKGMVLVLSLWTDNYSNMLWLDSTYPEGATGPGAERGSCSPTSGDPDETVANYPDAAVQFSNIKFGPIGSTYNSGTTPPPPGTTLTTSARTTTTTTSTARPTTTQGGTSPPPSGSVPKWGQCGGINYTGPTGCVSGSTCTKLNDWYFQCL